MLLLFDFLLDLQAKCRTSNQKKELKWNRGITHESCIIYLRLSGSEEVFFGGGASDAGEHTFPWDGVRVVEWASLPVPLKNVFILCNTLITSPILPDMATCQYMCFKSNINT